MGDLLSASSLLLAVIGILYGFWYGDLASAKSTAVPDHAANCTAPRIMVSGVLWSRALPLAVSSVILALVFLPDTFRIINESYTFYCSESIALKSYDAVRTAFCVVVMFKVILAIHLTITVCQLVSLQRSLCKKEDSS